MVTCPPPAKRISEKPVQEYFELLALLSITPRENISLKRVLETILDSVLHLTDLDAGAVYLKGDGEKVMQLAASQGFSTAYLETMRFVTLGQGFSGRAAQIGDLRITETRQGDPRFIRPASEREGYKTFLSVPLCNTCYPSESLGVMNLASRKRIKLPAEQLQLLRLLGRQLGNMLASYRLFQTAERREKWAQGFYSIAVEIQPLHDANSICQIVADEARILFDADCSIIAAELDSEEPMIMAYSGCLDTDQPPKYAEAFWNKLLKGSGLCTLDVTGTVADSLASTSSPLNTWVLCTLPKQGTTSELYGLFALGYLKSKELSEEKRALERLSNQVAVALYNAKLYRDAQDLATIRERNWIAREMHDSLAQALASSRIDICNAKKLFEAHREPEALTILNKAENTLKRAYTEVREIILGLSSRSETKGLVELLHNYLDFFSAETGITIKSFLPAKLKIPPRIETQLIRILQESLTNVRKHANATEVSVRLAVAGPNLVLTVKDNGRGFALNNMPRRRGHFGLAVMQERAQLAGGNFTITSKPGQGTEIIVSFPLDSNPGRQCN